MDIVERIKADHRRAQELLGQIKLAAPEEVGPLFETLDKDLTIHADAAEAAFYPDAESLSHARHQIQRVVQTHLEERHLLADLRQLSPEKPVFGEKIRQLQRSVEEHIREEEQKLIPRLRERITPEQLDHLDKEFCEAKARRMREMAGGRVKEVTTLDFTSMKD